MAERVPAKRREFDAFSGLQNNVWAQLRIAKELKGQLHGLKGKRILEIGVGNGSLMELLESQGAEAHGIDVRWENVKAARRRGLKRVVKGNAAALEKSFSAKRPFDAVVSSRVLEPVVVNKADARRILEGAYALTRPGGVHVHYTFEAGPAPQLLKDAGMKVLKKENLGHDREYHHLVVAKKPN